MTEEIRYIANLQRQEEFDNEVTELKDELKRLEQENKELQERLLEDKILDEHIESLSQEDNYRSALEEIRDTLNKIYNVCDDNCGNARKLKLIIDTINEVLE